MATINGRYVRWTDKHEGELVGVVSGWSPQSDWAMVTLQDGSRRQIHWSDQPDVLPANYKFSSSVTPDKGA